MVQQSAGTLPVAHVTRKKIENGILQRGPNPGRLLYMSMRSMFLWAVGAELHDNDPTAGINLKRTDRDGNDGHLAWPIEVIEQYEKRWPVGTRERLIFDIHLSA